MADVKWIKISTDIFDNRKIKQIEHMPEGDALIVIWFKLLILAGDTNDGGQVYLTQEIPYTEPLLANQFNRPIQLIQLALHTFEQFNMIEIVDDIIHISNWEKYQNVEGMERCREKTRLRVQKFRAKKKLEETKLLEDVTLHETLQETLPKRSVTHLEEEGEREKEEDKKYISPSSEVEPPTEKASASILTKTQQSRFDAFWKVYPKKVGKQDAMKAWKKIAPDEELTDTIIRAVETAKQKDSRFREERFIPHPATWLNAGSWENEYDDYFPAQEQPKPQAPKPQSEDSLRQLDVDGFLAAATRRRRT